MRSRWIFTTYLFILFLLLTLPELMAYHVVGTLSLENSIWSSLIALAYVGCYLGLLKLIPHHLVFYALLTLAGLLIFLRFIYLGLVIFSGAGFTSEFFIHLEWQSAVIAWQEYPRIILTGTIAVITLFAAGYHIGKRIHLPGLMVTIVMLLVCSTTIFSRPTSPPEGEFFHALVRWHQPLNFSIKPEHLEEWRTYPLLETDLLGKRDLKVHPSSQPLNIILVYLESMGTPILHHSSWPNLMPNLNALSKSNRYVPNYYSSGYITIEGVVNSQCGTLFPFDRDGDSLTGTEGLAENMACFGDILSAAGYRSSYLGGANMAYAGKGDFLKSHGYHSLKGAEYWSTIGLHQRPDTWGVSDADLFSQAYKELLELKESGKPFNLTLLTIGTHLPGYSYIECKPYKDGSERFLNAIHCTDQLLSQWVHRLESEGLLKDTLLVITADHPVFSSPEMRRLFGDEALNDRRLPLIVIDPLDRRSPLNYGAAYDLAPTLLDLAGVEHNYRFALGRSLANSENERSYFFGRYADALPGVADIYAHGQCGENKRASLSIPLHPCARNELKNLLRTQIRDLSKSIASLDCEKPALTRVKLPLELDQPLSIAFTGSDQSRNFIQSPKRVEPTTRGIYLARIQKNSEVHRKVFYSPSTTSSMANPPAIETDDAAWLIVSLGNPENVPAWLSPEDTLASTSSAGLWIAKTSNGRIEWLNKKHENLYGNEWRMDKEICAYLLAQDDLTNEPTPVAATD